jgi:hypothetical protein
METKNNDQKIMELKKQIEDKKKLITKAQKFSPITNCSIEVDGIRHNIQVLNREQLIALLIKLTSYSAAAKELGMLADYSISGFNVVNWITDIKAKLDVVSKKEEEAKLKAMESKLDQLLSNEKKTELEIDEIMNLLGK